MVVKNGEPMYLLVIAMAAFFLIPTVSPVLVCKESGYYHTSDCKANCERPEAVTKIWAEIKYEPCPVCHNDSSENVNEYVSP